MAQGFESLAIQRRCREPLCQNVSRRSALRLPAPLAGDCACTADRLAGTASPALIVVYRAASMDRWDELRFLLAVSRHGTLAAAGRALRVNATIVVGRLLEASIRAGYGSSHRADEPPVGCMLDARCSTAKNPIDLAALRRSHKSLNGRTICEVIYAERGEPGPPHQDQGRVERVGSADVVGRGSYADPGGVPAAPRGVHRTHVEHGNALRRRSEGPRAIVRLLAREAVGCERVSSRSSANPSGV